MTRRQRWWLTVCTLLVPAYFFYAGLLGRTIGNLVNQGFISAFVGPFLCMLGALSPLVAVGLYVLWVKVEIKDE